MPFRFIACCAMSAALALSVSAATVRGAWTMVPDSDSRVHLNVQTGAYNNFGEGINLSEFTGLSNDALRANTSTPVTFQLRRDAGTFVFEGNFRSGFGGGEVTFTPDARYAQALESFGFKVEPTATRSVDDILFSLAMVDVSVAYIRTMREVFPSATFKDMTRLRGVGVTPEYIREIRSVGMEITDAHDATRLAGVGVTADYVRSLRAAGIDVRTAHDATRLKGVDVTPQFVKELEDAGYKNLTVHDLVRLAGAGVNREFIRDMSKYKEKP